ncbi:hypothetical protein L7F22_012191 [Adiantum nelumboides]|nr:hypothetical protein [Adiantum nelumboides]
MASRKVAAAIAAGCTTVLKPAGETPLASLAMGMIALRSGVPPGVLNVVTALDNTAALGQLLSTDVRVKKLSLTGSTRVGKLLATNAASTLKKLSLELGGNSPVIIFDDANMAKVVAQRAAQQAAQRWTDVCGGQPYLCTAQRPRRRGQAPCRRDGQDGRRRRARAIVGHWTAHLDGGRGKGVEACAAGDAAGRQGCLGRRRQDVPA